MKADKKNNALEGFKKARLEPLKEIGQDQLARTGVPLRLGLRSGLTWKVARKQLAPLGASTRISLHCLACASIRGDSSNLGNAQSIVAFKLVTDGDRRAQQSVMPGAVGN